uniref:Mos1 transposase HTH domain-containing protein n=1 Tax=Lutzomyia longipalpis TaxID=7200 RepID=A0A1B0CT63_LUTLO
MCDPDEDYLGQEIGIKCEPFEIQEVSQITIKSEFLDEKDQEMSKESSSSSVPEFPEHSWDNQEDNEYSKEYSPVSVCKNHIHHVLLHYKITKKTPSQAYQNICSIYGKNSISLRQCYRWYKKLTIKDQHCPCCSAQTKKPTGRPSKFDTEQIREFSRKNPDMPLQDMSLRLGIPKSTLFWHISKRKIKEETEHS